MALKALKRQNSGNNGMELEKLQRLRRWTEKIAALTVFNRQNSGINVVYPEKSSFDSVEPEKDQR